MALGRWNKRQEKGDQTNSEFVIQKGRHELHLKPYLTTNGELIIPFNSDQKYLWYKGGQAILTTLIELQATEEIIDKYIENWREQEDGKRYLNIKG